MSLVGQAVFLSYAREDIGRAKRIADALRATGVEVWFDQDELVGGDAWDQKIRKQIGSCALFVPIISANTQARAEGYFRLEWKLADRRMDLIGKSKAFLLPVCIDETREGEADVPDSFMAVQWTRFRDGEATPAFVARVQKLLVDGTGALSDRVRASTASEDPPKPSRSEGRRPWVVPVIVGTALAGLALVLWRFGDPRASDSLGLRPTPEAPSMAPLSPAGQLIAKSARLHDQLENASRGDLELAEQYCRQAVALDPTDGEAWAEYALVISNFVAMNYDRSDQRLQAMRSHAERAVKLAPDSNTAQLAFATSFRWQAATQEEAIRRLRELAARLPDNRQVLRALGNALRTSGQAEESLAWYNRAAALPGGDPLALFQRAMAYDALERYDEAIASLDESLALHPAAAAYILKVLMLTRRGELEPARAALDKVPAPFLVEDRGALAASRVYYLQRQWDQGLNALLAVPRDFFDDAFYTGPKGLLTGDIRFHAGRKIAAELDWKAALQSVNQRLASAGNSAVLHRRKAELHARLGQAEEADRAMRAFEELRGSAGGSMFSRQRISLFLGRTEATIQSLQSGRLTREDIADLRQDPYWDPLRGDPRFQALVAESAVPPPTPGGTALPRPTDPDGKSIAVLPFENRSSDPENAYFADGMHDEILTTLAQVGALRVVSRTSVLEYRGTTKKIPQIGRELGVAHVLEGSVQRAGQRVRVTAQLIRAATDEHLWAQTFDRDLTDVFALQSELAQAIAQRLGATLSPREREQLGQQDTTNPAAYELFLKARDVTKLLARKEDYRRRETLLQSAVELDPKFAVAWAELATSHAEMIAASVDCTPARLTKAEAAIQRATALAPDAPEVMRARGVYFLFGQLDTAKAREEFTKLVQLQPNNPENLGLLGTAHLLAGEWRQALEYQQQAARLDPASSRHGGALVLTLMRARRWDEAKREADRRAGGNAEPAVYAGLSAWIEFYATGAMDATEALLAKREAEGQAAASLAELRKRIALVRRDYARVLDLDRQFPSVLDYGGGTEMGALKIVALLLMQGERQAAVARLGGHPATLRAQLELDPDNTQLLRISAVIEALQGEKDLALRHIGRAAELVPPTKDAPRGLNISMARLIVLAWTGEKEAALAELARLIQLPTIMTVHQLKTDPLLSPLWGDPRFEAIVNDPKNNAPLF